MPPNNLHLSQRDTPHFLHGLQYFYTGINKSALFNGTAEENVTTMCSLSLRFTATLVLGGINMFIKKCAKIRGKLAVNWRHLQNKGEDGEVVVWRAIKEEIGLLGWPPPISWWGRHLKRGDLVC